MITIKSLSHSDFEVTVISKNITSHSVHISKDFYQNLTKGHVSYEDLIRISFEFLLERESNNSILSKFNLDIISNFFPEYENEMKRKFIV